MQLKDRKIAIVYDWIDKWGGVERVLLTLHEIFPEAEFYTSYFDPENANWATDLKIHTSFIQKLPKFIRKSRLLSFFLYPYAFESFKFPNDSTVISVSSSFAKSVITRPETQHICYLLTPTRYIWIEPDTYLKGIKQLGKLFLPKLRVWDAVSAQRPDTIISISEEVRERCKKFYNRDSEVIYPPFDNEYWNEIKSKVKVKNGGYFLVVSRLEPYKRIDIAVNAFNDLPHLNLIIVGKGSEEQKLRAAAKDNITFLTDVPDTELASLYQNAMALIMTQREEFGYVALEAQFFGCPVVAFGKGGVRETVTDNETGIFFENQTVQSLKTTLGKFEKIAPKLKQSTVKNAQKNIEKFSKKNFVEKFLAFI